MSYSRLFARPSVTLGLIRFTLSIFVFNITSQLLSISVFSGSNAFAAEPSPACPLVDVETADKTSSAIIANFKKLSQCVDALQGQIRELREQPPIQVDKIVCKRNPITTDNTAVIQNGSVVPNELEIEFDAIECDNSKIQPGWIYIPVLLGTDVCGGYTEYVFPPTPTDTRSLSIHLYRYPSRPQCSDPKNQGSITAAWIGIRTPR
jgi:hypothetical protein